MIYSLCSTKFSMQRLKNKSNISIPLVADIHLITSYYGSYSKWGDKIRISTVILALIVKGSVDVAKDRNIPIRVEQQASLEKEPLIHGVYARTCKVL